MKSKYKTARWLLLCLVFLSACSASPHEQLRGEWLLNFDQSQWQDKLSVDSLTTELQSNKSTPQTHDIKEKLGSYRLSFDGGKHFQFQRNLLKTQGFYTLLPKEELLIFTYGNRQDTFHVKKLKKEKLILEKGSLQLHFEKQAP
jgi:5-hydroxyisourate hydrolase-like protein (transthyretin family)